MWLLTSLEHVSLSLWFQITWCFTDGMQQIEHLRQHHSFCDIAVYILQPLLHNLVFKDLTTKTHYYTLSYISQTCAISFDCICFLVVDFLAFVSWQYLSIWCDAFTTRIHTDIECVTGQIKGKIERQKNTWTTGNVKVPRHKSIHSRINCTTIFMEFSYDIRDS